MIVGVVTCNLLWSMDAWSDILYLVRDVGERFCSIT